MKAAAARARPRKRPMVEFRREFGPGWCDMQLPVVVVSEANRREHWASKHRRATTQKKALVLSLMPLILWRQVRGGRFKLTFTRLYRGSRPMDSDNLAGAFKACRDAVAGWLGIDDGSDRLQWKYRQEKAVGNGIRIRVEVMP